MSSETTHSVGIDVPSDVAISVRGITKSYTIQHQANGPAEPPPPLHKRLRSPKFTRLQKETFWALNGVSFDVQRGDVVGVIGRNGAGKSTLLKVLSRITEPTAGEAIVRGRLGSLLEVGTGFHPELTGRENVYLNGAILGMSRREIDRQFDAIVDFSGTEKFLDTPVKRYSSGMYVRLAFAVAAHLEPEVLILDEVLAVGDGDFQKKCLGKIKDVAQDGRTILFVSHSMNSVLQLCNRCLYLSRGVVQAFGPSHEVVAKYIAEGQQESYERTWDEEEAPGNDFARLLDVRVRGIVGDARGEYSLSEPFFIEMRFRVLRGGLVIHPHFHLYNAQDVCVFASGSNANSEWGGREFDCGEYRAVCEVPRNFLNDGRYRVGAFVVHNMTHIDVSEFNAVSINVYDDGTGRGEYVGTWIGVTRPLLEWHIEPVSGGTGK